MKKKTIVLAMIACLLWASAFPTLKSMYTVMEVGRGYGIKILLAGVRFSLAGILILIFYTVRFRKMPLVKKDQWGQVLLLGTFQTSLMYAFYYTGIYNIPGVKSSILSQMSIFLVVIFSHFIYHDDKMHLGKWLGLAMGLAGIIVVNLTNLGGADMFSFSFQGEGLLMTSGIFSAISTFYAKKLSKTITPILMNGWQILSGGIVMTVLGLLTSDETLNFSNPASVPLLIYSAVISSGAFTLWYVLLQTNKASEMAMLRFSIPIFGAIMSALFLPGERLTPYILVSMVLVSWGIYQCNRPVPGKATSQENTN